jgi:flagellum-specific peptidoglycan hydrolase FlgJ
MIKKYLIFGVVGVVVFYLLSKFKTKKIDEKITKFGRDSNPIKKKVMFSGKADYIKKMLPVAKAIQQMYGVPYEFLLAQTGLETGLGKSSLVGEAFNFGGIKAKTGQPFVTKWTTEYTKDLSKYPNRDKSKDLKVGDKYKILVQQKFAKYDSLQEGVEAYIKVLQLPRYKAAFRETDPVKFAIEIKKGGYATDINYIPKLEKIINEIN